MSTGFQILVTLHILCVIGGFGAVSYNGLYVNLAQRRAGTPGTSAVLEVNSLVSGLAELLIYAALVFGVGAVTASQSTLKFSQAWLSAAVAVYLLDIAILHGWIRRHQRRLVVLARHVEEIQPAPGSQLPELREMAGIERRVSIGWGVFNVLVVGAVYLMVFKPGS